MALSFVVETSESSTPRTFTVARLMYAYGTTHGSRTFVRGAISVQCKSRLARREEAGHRNRASNTKSRSTRNPSQPKHVATGQNNTRERNDFSRFDDTPSCRMKSQPLSRDQRTDRRRSRATSRIECFGGTRRLLFYWFLACSAGCVLAISQSVWASWQRHLGQPTLTPTSTAGHFKLIKPAPLLPVPVGPDVPESKHLEAVQPTGELSAPAWIFVFEFDETAQVNPKRLKITKQILTDAHSFAYYALDVAPAAAVASAADIIRASLVKKLVKLWPAFAA
jgi:hypothetical protein